MKYIILDTETTGIEEDDRIIQLAYLVIDGDKKDIHQTFCTPAKEIGFQAMAVHHITPEMLENSDKLTDTNEYKLLNELNTPDNYLVIQNAIFDITMLEKEGFINNMKVIDTLLIAKHLFPELEKHSEQFLRYKLGLYKLEPQIMKDYGIKEIAAHDAIGDILVLKLLFDYLKNVENLDEKITKISNLTSVLDQNRLLLDNYLNDFSIDEKFYILTQIPVLLNDFRFGKHRGKLIKDVLRIDRSYINWMLNKMEDMSDELRYSLQFYLGNPPEVSINIPVVKEIIEKDEVLIPPYKPVQEDEDDIVQPSIFD